MTDHAQTLTFRCRPSGKMIAVSTLFFALCAGAMVYQAVTNTQGLILNGIIELTPAHATIFYGVIALLSALFVVAGGWTIFTTRIHGVPDVILTQDSLSFPHGFPVKRAFLLPLQEIRGYQQTEVNGQRFLTLLTATKKYHIVLNWLDSQEAESALIDALNSRLNC